MNDQIPIVDSKNFTISKELQDLAKSAKDFASNARSPNTNRAYQNDWKDFEFWCNRKKLASLPADPITVALYLTDLAQALKVSTLERRLTAISQVHQLAGHHFDRKHPAIKETWKGIRRSLGKAPNRKEPILVSDLKEMITALPEKLSSIRDKALILLGFAGAFRRSELVSLDKKDLKFISEGIIVTLRQSKTDQEKQGREVGIPYGSNPLTCPVRAIQEWLHESKIVEGPIFRPINRHHQILEKRLTDHSVAKIIKRNEHLMDNQENYSGHSLRAGLATNAAMAGVAEHLIMKQTGHKKSDTVKKYIRLGNLFTENAAGKVGL